MGIGKSEIGSRRSGDDGSGIHSQSATQITTCRLGPGKGTKNKGPPPRETAKGQERRPLRGIYMKQDGSTAPKAQGDKTLLRQVQFIKALTADPEVTLAGKAVANALMFTFWNKNDGYARPGQKKLAEVAGTNLSMVKSGIQSLKSRGWFCVQPIMDAKGDPAPNHYFPIWQRAESKPPVGSERKRKAPRGIKPPAEPIAFSAGPVRLTATEIADIEDKVGMYAMPFFDGLRKDAPDWQEDTWRVRLADRVANYAEDDEVIGTADDEEETPF